jgi:hypothetical protein
MDLQTQVKQKTNQLVVHRNALLSSLNRNLEDSSQRGLMLTFVIVPFVAGFICCRIKFVFVVTQYLQRAWILKSRYRL